MEYPWGHRRRFNAASNYFKKEFGMRVQKVSVDAGFTCPNRDGTKGIGGCIFCNNNAFNPSYCDPGKTISQQISEGIKFHEKRYKTAGKYLVYFQAFSNTYARPEVLKKKYSEALHFDHVIGIVIGTRPDCISDEILHYLKEISEEHYVSVEYGIESVYDKTLKRINRGHTFKDTVDAVQRTRSYGLKTGGHMIFGLPGETRKEMRESVEIVSQLPLHSIKFHQLQVIKDTMLAEEFLSHSSDFELFELDEYLQFITEYIGRLNPEFIIERIAGETQPWFNIGNRWNLRYDRVLDKMEKMMGKKNIWQGKYYKLRVTSDKYPVINKSLTRNS